MSVLELSGITKFYGAKLILDQVALSINARDRIALVGENGTGKTTIAQIIMGMIEPDEGHKRFPRDLEIGYLPQEAAIEEEMTVQQVLERSLGRLDHMRADLEAMEQMLSQPDL